MAETDGNEGKSLEENFKQMTDKIQEKVQTFYEKNGKMKDQNKKLKLDIKGKDNEINYWKQKFEESVRLSEIKDAEDQKRTDLLEFEIAEYKVNMEQLNEKIDALYAKVDERDVTIQKLKSHGQRMQHQVEELTKENAALKITSQICTLQDVVVNGEIDYERLNGRILQGEQLRYIFGTWYLDGIEILFEHSDFQISVLNELSVGCHQNFSFVLNRIFYNNLRELHLYHITTTFNDYKKLATTNQISFLKLHYVTINDENGVKVEIDRLWKETKNVKHLSYYFNDGEITSKTAQKLAILPPFPKLCYVYLSNVQAGFDLKTFGEFLINNPTIVECKLYCKCSDEFYNELKCVAEELISTLPSTCSLSVLKLTRKHKRKKMLKNKNSATSNECGI